MGTDGSFIAKFHHGHRRGRRRCGGITGQGRIRKWGGEEAERVDPAAVIHTRSYSLYFKPPLLFSLLFHMSPKEEARILIGSPRTYEDGSINILLTYLVQYLPSFFPWVTLLNITGCSFQPATHFFWNDMLYLPSGRFLHIAPSASSFFFFEAVVWVFRAQHYICI